MPPNWWCSLFIERFSPICDAWSLTECKISCTSWGARIARDKALPWGALPDSLTLPPVNKTGSRRIGRCYHSPRLAPHARWGELEWSSVFAAFRLKPLPQYRFRSFSPQHALVAVENEIHYHYQLAAIEIRYGASRIPTLTHEKRNAANRAKYCTPRSAPIPPSNAPGRAHCARWSAPSSA